LKQNLGEWLEDPKGKWSCWAQVEKGTLYCKEGHAWREYRNNRDIGRPGGLFIKTNRMLNNPSRQPPSRYQLPSTPNNRCHIGVILIP